MAEIQESGGGGGKKGKKVRSKKHSTHVDMTPMVDLAFLLLTFFLFTTTLNKPKAMEVIMPKPPDEQTTDPPPVKESNAMTIIMGPKRVYYYYGFRDPKVEAASYSATAKNAIRKAIVWKKKECEGRLNADGKPNRITILIKASKDAVYRNVVDILDEMNISEVPAYAVVDITSKEEEMIATVQ